MTQNNEMYAAYRAALVGVGYLYEDYDGPLSSEMIEAAEKLIEERSDKPEPEIRVSNSRG